MYLDTLTTLRRHGAPLARVDAESLTAFVDADRPDVLHFGHICAYRHTADDRAPVTVGELSRDRLCPDCAETLPAFALTWLQSAHLIVESIDAIGGLRRKAEAETAALLAGGPAAGDLLRLASRCNALYRLTGRPSTAPPEVARWYREQADAAAGTLAACRAELVADESWVTSLTGHPAGPRRYLHVPRPAITSSSRLPAQLAVGVYSTLGTAPGIDVNKTPLLFAAPAALAEEPTGPINGSEPTWLGPALSDDPAGLPPLALQLAGDAAEDDPLADLDTAVTAARGVLTA